jgi:hypothetical protein
MEDPMREPVEKSMTRRRRLAREAAKRAARVRIQKTGRKQMVRQSGRRRGGR